MYTLRVQSFLVCHLEKPGQYVAAHLGRTRLPGNPEEVTATRDFNIEAAFDLPQVFIKLAAKVGKAAVIGWLENYIPRYLDSIQDLYW